MKKVSEASSAYVVGESLPGDLLLAAEFDLPPEFDWFNELNVQERVDFFTGLLKVFAMPDGSWPNGRPCTLRDAINGYVRGWQTTVELESSPEAMESHERALADVKNGRFVSYEEVFGDVRTRLH